MPPVSCRPTDWQCRSWERDVGEQRRRGEQDRGDDRALARSALLGLGRTDALPPQVAAALGDHGG